MKHKWIRLLALVVLLLGLVACNTSTDEVTAEVPEFTDADIDAAQPLSSVSTERLNLSALSGEALRLSRSSTQSALAGVERSQLETSSANNANVPNIALDTRGYVAYVQELSAIPFTSIRVRRTNQYGIAVGQLIYRGRRQVDSVAVNQDGTFLTFVIQAEDGNFEVYALDRTGDTFGIEQLVRLTQTEADESNISMSLDGKTHLWQGVDDETELANFTLATIDIDAPAVSVLTVAAPFGLLEPSLSGDASLITLIADTEGGELVATVPSDLSSGLTGLYSGADFSAPSLSLAGDKLMFKATDGGADLVGFDNGNELSFLKTAPAGSIDHPYLTSDASYFVYSQAGEVRLSEINTDDPDAADEDIIDEVGADVNRATYWAKMGLELRYFSTTLDAPEFTRPDDGSGLSDADRTSPYQVYTFRVSVGDLYQIQSFQDFDGYLLLYEGSFNPNNPSRNLIAENDDFGGGYSPDNDPAGTSSLTEELEPGLYTVVTTACGNPDAGCGPDAGAFLNVIMRGGVPPIPPVTLPEPDNSRYNITLVFSTDETTQSLTPEQKQVFIDAGERWSNIITEDLADVSDFSLPQDQYVPGGPPIQGTIDDVVIFVRFGELDGPLGRAGPRLVRSTGTPDENLTTVGFMEFEITEFEPGGFFENEQQYNDVIVHEMGHVIGIGTLWSLTGNVDENYIPTNPPTVPAGLPNPDYDPGFTGPLALGEYNVLRTNKGLEEAGTVPIANTGGPGNYNGHWREIVFRNELMTPFAAGLEELSRMTAASLGDVGYTVNVDSEAVDQGYALPDNIPAVFKQLSPDNITYTEYEDFAAFLGEPSSAEGSVEVVDINLTPPRESDSGCEPEDFDGFTAGNIALVQRGTCPFITKFANAKAAGAIGVIVFNQGNGDDPARFGLFGGSNNQDIPAIAIPYQLGEDFANLIEGGTELEVLIDTTGDAANQAQLRAASFKEEILMPIGTVSPNGKIKLFD